MIADHEAEPAGRVCGAAQSVDLLALLEQNTRLIRVTQELTERIKELTDEIHRRVASH